MSSVDPSFERRPLLSVVTPVFNEADSLKAIHTRLTAAATEANMDLEWIAVDDHSRDDSYQILTRLASEDVRVRVIRLSRNFGSHAAITCGLVAAAGDAIVVMAADLQEAPESIVALAEQWRLGAQVVWGVPGGPRSQRQPLLSRVYQRLIHKVIGADSLPPGNADFVLMDRLVVDVVCEARDSRTPVFMLISWLGFRQQSVDCPKSRREHGESGWTLGNKFELVADSLIAFTERPLRWIGMLGLLTSGVGFAYAAVVIANAVLGHPAAGWSSLMIVVLVLGGGQMLMLGVIGSYVWRSLDQTRRRPMYVIESTAGPELHHHVPDIPASRKRSSVNP